MTFWEIFLGSWLLVGLILGVAAHAGADRATRDRHFFSTMGTFVLLWPAIVYVYLRRPHP